MKLGTSKKISALSVVLWALVVVWMGVIFSFSAQDAESSTGTSDVITDAVTSEIVKDYDSMAEKDQMLVRSVINYFVRKGGHFTEYFILGVLLVAAFSSSGKARISRAGISLAICFLYACSDEFHQSFVDGRGPAFFDVCIDTTGALFGIAISFGLACMIFMILARKKAKKSKNLLEENSNAL